MPIEGQAGVLVVVKIHHELAADESLLVQVLRVVGIPGGAADRDAIEQGEVLVVDQRPGRVGLEPVVAVARYRGRVGENDLGVGSGGGGAKDKIESAADKGVVAHHHGL